MTAIQAWMAPRAGEPFELAGLDLGSLAPDAVEIAVEHCGLCSADVSMWRDRWSATRFPFVPGHEIVGRIVAAGTSVDPARIGQRVGVGWINGSCMTCWSCLGGDQHLCRSRRRTIFAQPGGFASHVRSHWAWAIPLPDALDAATAGPLFCAGITVFRPLLELPVLPTWRVAVTGLGGLGHLAVKFLAAWGCEVVALTSDASKADDARGLGASSIVPLDAGEDALARLAGSIDLVVVTTPHPPEWPRLTALLAPRGRIHVLATLAQPIPVPSSVLCGGDRSIAGSSTGSPVAVKTMLDFCARHDVRPQVERFPMSRINEAMARLESGRTRYRIVLDADFGSAFARG